MIGPLHAFLAGNVSLGGCTNRDDRVSYPVDEPVGVVDVEIVGEVKVGTLAARPVGGQNQIMA